MKIDKAKVRYVKEEPRVEVKNKNSRVSAYTEDFKGEYYNLKMEKLIPFKNQARMHFDQESLESLAQTIKEHGIRQPLTVIPSEDRSGYYEIVSGERRFRAAKILKLETVPCIIIHDKKRAEEIAIIENIQRKDLHPVELMNAYNNLLKHDICSSIVDIAKKLGVARTSVIDILNLKKLTDNVQQYLVEKGIKNRDFLRELCKTEERKQLDRIHDFLNQMNQVKQERLVSNKSKPLHTRAKILEIVLDGEEIKIIKDRTEKLSEEHKAKMKELIETLM
jgi:ParB family chromosome partitioning protein